MKNFKTYAWYFPNWHQTVQNDKWHGKGWTEWQVVKHATPRFDGHLQPKKPLWGYEDESDPKVFAKKIDTIHKYGVDGFLFDFYWFKGSGPYRRDCLDKGFLGAENNHLSEFAVMWCNHDPIYVHPAAYMHKNCELESGDVDEALVREVTDYCIENYFCKENYIRIDGKIYFGLWDTEKFINSFECIDVAASVLNDFRSRAKKAGYDIHLAVHKSKVPGFLSRNKELFESTVKKLGIDSMFTYSWNMPQPAVWPIVEYSDYRKNTLEIAEKELEFSTIPLSLTVSSGWDSSPRTLQSDMYDEEAGWPFSPITVNNTPEELEISFKSIKKVMENDNHKGSYLTLSTWNEWTEGNFFEPDELYGYGYLEAFKKVFDK